MKESIGATQIFLIVVTLVLLFTGIMAFTINRSNAYAVKDEIVSILERAGGFDLTTELTASGSYSGKSSDALKSISDALTHNSYRQVGMCPDVTESDTYIEVSSYQRDGRRTMGDQKASFCIVRINANPEGEGTGPTGAARNYYYQVIVFYSLDLPVIKEVFNFRLVGETKPLYS